MVPPFGVIDGAAAVGSTAVPPASYAPRSYGPLRAAPVMSTGTSTNVIPASIAGEPLFGRKSYGDVTLVNIGSATWFAVTSVPDGVEFRRLAPNTRFSVTCRLFMLPW